MKRTGTLYDFVDREEMSPSSSEFQNYLKELMKEKEEPVRGLTVISETPPVDLFSEFQLADYKVKIKSRDKISEGHLKRVRESEIYEDGVRYFEDSFLTISHDEPEIYTILCVSDKSFFDKGLCRYIEALPSKISSSFLSSEDLRRLIQVIDRKINGNLAVKKAVLKTTNKDTEIEYHQEEIEYSGIFNEATAENKYVDKIQLSLEHSDSSFNFFVSRDGESRFIDGDIALYIDTLLPGVAGQLSDKDTLFKNRARQYGSRDADPLKIQYKEGAIQGVEQNRRLVKALKGVSRSSITVYHDNPYLHASLLDFDDGTNVDVYLTSDHAISIIPGFNASRKSLSRICNQINKGFFEGDVVAPEDQEERSFEEYFSPA
jgi:hypothetical protein